MKIKEWLKPKPKSGIDAAVKKLSTSLKVEARLLRGSDRSWSVQSANNDCVHYGAEIWVSVEGCSGVLRPRGGDNGDAAGKAE